MLAAALTMLVSAVALAYDAATLPAAVIGKIRRFGAAWHQWIVEICWLGVLAAALITWPNGLNPPQHPIDSLLLSAAITVAPLFLLERSQPETRAREMANLYSRGILILSVLVATALTMGYLIRVRPAVEGVDFFYYVCFARDLAAGFTDVPSARYLYFPGVYTFWRAALSMGGGTLESLQWCFLGLLVANASLVAVIVARAARTLWPGVFAAFWYLVLCSRFEAFYGVTEPLATLPVLAGLVVWGGRSLQGFSGLLRAVGLGAGIGLGLYAKQQAGLLAVGAVSLLATSRGVAQSDRHRLPQLVTIPVVASFVLLVAILFERQGLEPLRIGLSEIQSYDREGSFLENLRRASSLAGPLIGASVLAMSMWLTIVTIPQLRPLLVHHWARLLGFCICSAAAALLPFARRPYLHYALLPLPVLVISVLCCTVGLARLLPETVRLNPLARLLALFLAVIPLAGGAASPYLRLWPLEFASGTEQPAPWRSDPIIASDLRSIQIQEVLRSGEDLLVLPPRRNEVHFLLHTRSVSFPLGYGWYRSVHLSETLRSPRLAGVITIDPSFLDATDRAVCEKFDCAQSKALLGRYGFRPVTALRSMTLWLRNQR